MDKKTIAASLKKLIKLATDEPTPEVEVQAMEEAILTDGTIVKYEILEVGQALTVVTSEGEMPAPDAVHEIENGTLVTTVDGVITEIVEGAPVVEEDEEMAEFKDMMDSLGLTFKEIRESNAKLKEENEALKAEFAEVKEGNAKIIAEFSDLKKEVELARAEPSAPAASKPKNKTIKQFKTALKK